MTRMCYPWAVAGVPNSADSSGAFGLAESRNTTNLTELARGFEGAVGVLRNVSITLPTAPLATEAWDVDVFEGNALGSGTKFADLVDFAEGDTRKVQAGEVVLDGTEIGTNIRAQPTNTPAGGASQRWLATYEFEADAVDGWVASCGGAGNEATGSPGWFSLYADDIKGSFNESKIIVGEDCVLDEIVLRMEGTFTTGVYRIEVEVNGSLTGDFLDFSAAGRQTLSAIGLALSKGDFIALRRTLQSGAADNINLYSVTPLFVGDPGVYWIPSMSPFATIWDAGLGTAFAPMGWLRFPAPWNATESEEEQFISPGNGAENSPDIHMRRLQFSLQQASTTWTLTVRKNRADTVATLLCNGTAIQEWIGDVVYDAEADVISYKVVEEPSAGNVDPYMTTSFFAPGREVLRMMGAAGT